jgi:hypothetical protein
MPKIAHAPPSPAKQAASQASGAVGRQADTEAAGAADRGGCAAGRGDAAQAEAQNATPNATAVAGKVPLAGL